MHLFILLYLLLQSYVVPADIYKCERHTKHKVYVQFQETRCKAGYETTKILLPNSINLRQIPLTPRASTTQTPNKLEPRKRRAGDKQPRRTKAKKPKKTKAKVRYSSKRKLKPKAVKQPRQAKALQADCMRIKSNIALLTERVSGNRSYTAEERNKYKTQLGEYQRLYHQVCTDRN